MIAVTDYYSNKLLHTIEHSELATSSAGCQFSLSPTGKYLAVGNTGGALLIFNLRDKHLEEVYEEHQTVVVSTAWDGSSNRIATSDTLGNVFIWE